MKERIDPNPRSEEKLSRGSDAHREPTFPMGIRRAHEQTSAQLRKDSLAISEKKEK